jgi:hypothetical protein
MTARSLDDLTIVATRLESGAYAITYPDGTTDSGSSKTVANIKIQGWLRRRLGKPVVIPLGLIRWQ